MNNLVSFCITSLATLLIPMHLLCAGAALHLRPHQEHSTTLKRIACYTPPAIALIGIGSNHIGLQQAYRVSTVTMQNIQWCCFTASLAIIVGYIIYLHRQINKSTKWINTYGKWSLETTAENTINLNAQRNGVGIEFTIFNRRLNRVEGPNPEPLDPALAAIREEAGKTYEEDPRTFIATSIFSQENFQTGNQRKNNDFDADIDERMAQYEQARNKRKAGRDQHHT